MMVSNIRFRADGEYFKVGNIIFRRPEPGSADMDKFRERFFEMTGEPYEVYEARLAEQKAKNSLMGFWNRVTAWITSWFDLAAAQPPQLKPEKPADGKTKSDKNP